jgi:putative phosphoesterase
MRGRWIDGEGGLGIISATSQPCQKYAETHRTDISDNPPKIQEMTVKIGVLSDSHDNVPMVNKAVELFNDEGVALVIHAGDFIAPFVVAAMGDLKCRVVGVFGNNDGDRIAIAKRFEAIGVIHPNLAIAEIGGRTIAATHYPELAEPIAKSGQYNIVIYGHTHRIDIRRETSLILNPGETGGWTTGRCTVAIVELDTLEVEIHEL